MDAAHAEPQAELAPILQAVSRELTSLGDMGAVLQSVLSSLASAHTGLANEMHAPASEDIQVLDLFTQRLCVLADFLNTLTPTVTPGSCGNLCLALGAVNLADVARRLGAEAPGEDERVYAGDLEMFGDDP